jgi:uncharacterized protein YndB with AHSA1/START domain
MTSKTQKYSVTHSTFVVERIYPASPVRVFNAFADPRIKRRWFVEGEGWQVDEFVADFRVGGREFSRFRFQGGPPVTNETIYLDIVPQHRLVFAYCMAVDGARISASLATVEITPLGTSSRLVFAEQGAFLDGNDDLKGRELGTQELLDKLGIELQQA